MRLCLPRTADYRVSQPIEIVEDWALGMQVLATLPRTLPVDQDLFILAR